jgi:hypothetical protein
MTYFAIVLALLAPPQAARPAQIILFRHAEKPADKANPHLSPEGVRRARLLVGFLSTNPVVNKYGKPVAIFATRTTKDDDGQRTQETVAPAAAALKLAVQTPFLGRQYKQLANRILGNPAYAGKTVVICWNHDVISELAAELGVSPKPPAWKAKEYDQVYVISFRGKTATLTVMAENLRP